MNFGNVEHSADVVIGCDGVYSALRKDAIQDDSPLHYLGVMVGLGICASNHTLTESRIFQTSDGKGRFYSMPFKK